METFGQRMKKLRTGAVYSLTQEQLAEKLGITPQAISRWETDAAMPEIGLIVPLARMFGVSTDYLLGYDAATREAQVKAVLDDLSPDMWRDRETDTAFAQRNVDKLRQALAKYPGDFELSLSLAFALDIRTLEENDPTICKNAREEALALCGYVLNNCTKPETKYSAMRLRCEIASQMHDESKLDEYAGQLPHVFETREAVMMSNSKDACKCAKYARMFIAGLKLNLFNAITAIANDETETGQPRYTNEQKAELNRKLLDIFHTLHEKGEHLRNYGDLIYMAREQLQRDLEREGRIEEADRVFIDEVNDVMWDYDHPDELMEPSLIPAHSDEFYTWEYKREHMLCEAYALYTNVTRAPQMFGAHISRPKCRAAIERMEKALREAGRIE